MYREIILAIADYFNANKLYIREQLIKSFFHTNDVWHGIYFKCKIKEAIGFNINFEVDSNNIFLVITPQYKGGKRKGVDFIYENFQFPASLSEIPAFCEKLVNTHIPEILDNKILKKALTGL